jgi:hypothetical protein
VAVAGREGVGDLVQQSVPHFGLGVEKREWAGERDLLAPISARSKPPAGMIETKRPIPQRMLLEQSPGKFSGVGWVQCQFRHLP